MCDKIKGALETVSNMDEPTKNIFLKLLGKLGDVTGFWVKGHLALPLEEKKMALEEKKMALEEKRMVLEAQKLIVNEMATDQSIDQIERYAVVASIQKMAKEYENQAKIVFQSGKYLKNDAQPEKIDADWIFDFMDKAGKISNEEMQQIWGRILAQKANQPSTISKKMLRIIFEISREEAETFMKLVSVCIDIYEDGNFIETVPVVVENGDNSNKKYGISYQNLVDIESMGLINLDIKSNFVYEADKFMEFRYGDKTVTSINPKQSLRFGSVLFTKAGQELLQICVRTYDKEKYTRICKTIEFLNNPKNKLNL